MWFKKNRPVEVAEILVKVDAINFMKSLQIRISQTVCVYFCNLSNIL